MDSSPIGAQTTHRPREVLVVSAAGQPTFIDGNEGMTYEPYTCLKSVLPRERLMLEEPSV